MALVISATPTEYRIGDAATGALLFTATGATGTVNWSSNSGAMSPATGAGSTLDPVNRTQLVTVTAEDDVATVTKTIQIYATFPVQPKWEVEGDIDPPIVRWPMAYEKRSYAEYWGMLQFFKWHQKAVLEISEAEDGTVSVRIVKGKPFYVYDIASGLLAKVYFDSNVRHSEVAPNFVNYSFQLMGFAFEIPTTPTAGPWAGTEYGDPAFWA